MLDFSNVHVGMTIMICMQAGLFEVGHRLFSLHTLEIKSQHAKCIHTLSKILVFIAVLK